MKEPENCCNENVRSGSIIDAALFVYQNHGGSMSGFSYFVYCPWCGRKIHPENEKPKSEDGV